MTRILVSSPPTSSRRRQWTSSLLCCHVLLLKSGIVADAARTAFVSHSLSLQQQSSKSTPTLLHVMTFPPNSQVTSASLPEDDPLSENSYNKVKVASSPDYLLQTEDYSSLRRGNVAMDNDEEDRHFHYHPYDSSMERIEDDLALLSLWNDNSADGSGQSSIQYYTEIEDDFDFDKALEQWMNGDESALMTALYMNEMEVQQKESEAIIATQTETNVEVESSANTLEEQVRNTTDSKAENGKNQTGDNAKESSTNGEVRKLPTLPQLQLPAMDFRMQHHNDAMIRLYRRARQVIEEKKRQQAKQQQREAEQEAKRKDAQEQQQQGKGDDKENSMAFNGQMLLAKLWSNIVNRPRLISTRSEWKRLQKHAEYMNTLHLRDMLKDEERCNALYAVHDGVYLDYSRQRVTLDTMKFLFELAERQDLKGQIKAMVTGEKINFTEKRAVLHTALRADRSQVGTIMVDGMDVVKEVHEVLDQVKAFTNGVRSGKIRGYTGKLLRNIVSVGIGGSYLGPEFLHECLKTEPEGVNSALGYSLRFLSNVDPVDVERTCADLDPEETLIVIVSKTFTTAETMLNARTMRQWLWDFMGNDKDVVRKHMVACSSVSATDKVRAFGIDTDKYFFRFWDWVGGRYSVCSAAGAVPISLLYGFDLFEKFLRGAQSMDEHFINAPYEDNIPILMGLLGVWNMSFMGFKSRTTLPYAEALLKLPAHIQQLDMESNGKCMTKHGLEVDYPVGEIDFGEAGTNGQHSFYQLLHMGQIVPCEFIGFARSQHDFCVDGEHLSSHDELMANFFAQPDALAKGKTVEEVSAEGVSDDLVAHRVFKGNRPSLSLLLPKLTAYACGQILAIYEHRTAVQGFIWDINSFDQWGVELGKKLALEVKTHMIEARQRSRDASGSSEPYRVTDAANPATARLLNYYFNQSRDHCHDDQHVGNPLTRVTRKTHREHHPHHRSSDQSIDHGKSNNKRSK